MGDIGEVYNHLRDESKKKRASNRDKSTCILIDRGIEFEAKNSGAHLILDSNIGKIDFWPGTGKWRTRSGISGRGIFPLLKFISEVGK